MTDALVYFSPDITEVSRATVAHCFAHIGKGDGMAADRAAVTAMRNAFQKFPIRGQIAIGEGERDKAPMLYIGEKVGRWGAKDMECDIAVDPLEGTGLCAKGKDGALTVLAMAKRGDIITGPDVYMEKIACGPAGKGLVDLNNTPQANIRALARAKGKGVADMVVAILDRPRHSKLIQEVRDTGARVTLIEDGDLLASVLSVLSDHEVDLMMGTGGAPEGVLSACALKCQEGEFQGRWVFQNKEEQARAEKMGIVKDKVYHIEDLVPGPVLFCMAGVTKNPLLKGVYPQAGEEGKGSLELVCDKPSSSAENGCVVIEHLVMSSSLGGSYIKDSKAYPLSHSVKDVRP